MAKATCFTGHILLRGRKIARSTGPTRTTQSLITSTATSRSRAKPETGIGHASETDRARSRSVSGQCEHRQLAAERGVIPERGIATDRAEPGLWIRQARGKADPGPAADAREHRDVLLAV